MTTWLDVLLNASKQTTGVALLCDSPSLCDQAKRLIYSTRAKAQKTGNTDFDNLSVSMSPHSDSILFIWKNPEKTFKEPE